MAVLVTTNSTQVQVTTFSTVGMAGMSSMRVRGSIPFLRVLVMTSLMVLSERCLDAGAGNDRICAYGGNNTIRGGDGDDTINTGSGNDWIDGGAGNDTISLGGGQDIVVLARGFGVDRINNFQDSQTSWGYRAA
jgi:Ca2+-binding RTX toxin-like protein